MMKIQNMHNLFVDVLNSMDLSKAGDLFQIDDNLIVTDLSKLINQIEKISSAPNFIQQLNDQSVIEICLTRINSAIRDTGTIEKHCKALVSLLQSCLQHDLRPSKTKDSDPPHAKIANEIVSCIFLNHDKKNVMQLAVPVAVKLLHRGNKELSRNLSSYLSLAAINNAEILAEHLSLIIDSVISGNYCLSRVLPKIYPIKKEPIHDHIMALVCLLPQCETPEKLSLLSLFQLVSKVNPKILESNLPEFSECLEQSETAYPTLQVFLNMAQNNARPFLEYANKVVSACSLQGCMLSIAIDCYRFLSIIAKLDIDRACDCLCFLTLQLSKSDLSTTIVILKEIKSIVEVFPEILPNFFKDILMITKNSSSNTVQNYLQQLSALDQQNSSSLIVRVNCDQTNNSFLSNNLINNFNNNPSSLLYNQINLHESGQSQSKNSNFKLNSTNFKLPSTSSYKLVNSININPNNDLIHRSIPRIHSSSTHKIGKQLSCSSNRMHRSLTNCSNSKHNSHSDHSHYHHCSADSISTSNHALTHNSSPSSSNQNIVNFRNSRPEMSLMNVYHNTAVNNNHNLNMFGGDRSVATAISNYTNGIYSTNSSSKALLTSSNLLPSNTNSNILDNPQLLQLSSSSSFTTHQNNFLAYSLNNKSYTLTNHYYNYEHRDGIRQFCEKHFDKIKAYMDKMSVTIPLPVRCSIEERKSKKTSKLQLHFVCSNSKHNSHCLFSKTSFTMKTRNIRTWIHLMFLDLQAKADEPLYTSAPAVFELKNCYDDLKDHHKENSNGNKNFLTLITSSFPSVKDQDNLIQELENERYYDVFDFNESVKSWTCFMCNHPEKRNEFIDAKDPVIEGQLKEKRGKWKIFQRWRERYFTLTGLSLSYRDKNNKNEPIVRIGEVRSVRAIGSSKRNIPKAFEIFTNEHKTYLLKAKNSRMSSEWLQCLSVAMANSQAKEIGS